jgi:hypothetical protein
MAEPRIVKETITPSKAKQLVGTAGPTYRFRRNHCERIARDMAEGNFHPLQGHYLVVDETGTLHNGRHRLQAQMDEGKTYAYWVMYCNEADAAAFDLVGDVGASWTLSDHLRYMGIKDPFVTGSALTYLHRLDTGTVLHMSQPTRTQAVALLEENKDLVAYGPVVAQACREWRVPKGLATAVAYVTSCLPDVSEDDVTDFWTTLAGLSPSTDPEVMAAVVGELEHGNPLIALSNWLRKSMPSPRTSARRPETLTLALLFKAWNAYISHDSIRLLRWGRKEKFPPILSSDGTSYAQGSDALRALLDS